MQKPNDSVSHAFRDAVGKGKRSSLQPQNRKQKYEHQLLQRFVSITPRLLLAGEDPVLARGNLARPHRLSFGGASSAQPYAVRFKGTLVTAESHQDYPARSELESLERPPILFFLTGAGRADTTEVGYPLLGSFTVMYAGMVDYASGGGHQCTRFINANGDSLFTNSSTQVRVTTVPSVMSVIEVHTVTGGTGYFAGTSGSFTINRALKLAAGGLSASSTGSFDGWIGWTSMAADRKDGATP